MLNNPSRSVTLPLISFGLYSFIMIYEIINAELPDTPYMNINAAIYQYSVTIDVRVKENSAKIFPINKLFFLPK